MLFNNETEGENKDEWIKYIKISIYEGNEDAMYFSQHYWIKEIELQQTKNEQ